MVKRVRIVLLTQSIRTQAGIELTETNSQQQLPSFLLGGDVTLLPRPAEFSLFRPSCLASYDIILVVYTDTEQNNRREVLQVCHELRKQFDGPLLLVSSIAEQEFQLAGYAVGIDEYIEESVASRALMLTKLGIWYNWSINASQKGHAGTDVQRRVPQEFGIEVNHVEWPDYMPDTLQSPNK